MFVFVSSQAETISNVTFVHVATISKTFVTSDFRGHSMDLKIYIPSDGSHAIAPLLRGLFVVPGTVKVRSQYVYRHHPCF